MRESRGRTVWILGAVLCLATLAVYSRAGSFEFLTVDDRNYVADNPHVQQGLTLDGIRWALTTGHASNWHPLTWVSHMVDVELYGSDPAGHHMTSVLLHAANSVLLFWLFTTLTGRPGRSAVLAALFALHPLHVESVAWIAERKDVLSALFGLLATLAYVAYARRGGVARYLLVALLLALGLMAKPMLVTLPLVFLLLDYWPLERPGTSPISWVSSQTRRRVLEKIPLLALSAASSLATLTAQRGGGAVVALEHVAFPLRLANAVVSYVRYIVKTFWPMDLSILYPHPYLSGGTPLRTWQIAGAAIVLIAASAFFLRPGRPRYLPVGWLLYLGTLVPVIGLVQVGQQALADRYTYLPLIGLFVIVTWGVGDWLASRNPRAAPILALAALTACAALTWSQLPTWRDSVTLLRHALSVSGSHPVAHNFLGLALNRAGRHAEAAAELERAVERAPRYADARYNLGNAYLSQGDYARAARQFRLRLEIEPGHAETHNNLANALLALQRIDDALAEYRRAVELDPDYADAHFNFGFALHSNGRLDEAVEQYRQVLRVDPVHPQANNNLGRALQDTGDLAGAAEHYRRALRAAPDSLEAHQNLGRTLLLAGDAAAAIREFRYALELRGDSPLALQGLADALRASGRHAEALRSYGAAAQARPDWPAPLAGLAWILAAAPDPALRDPQRAMVLAQQACAATGNRDPAMLDALAAAQASAGRFDRAAQTARAALELADPPLAVAIRARLAGYEQGLAFIEPEP